MYPKLKLWLRKSFSNVSFRSILLFTLLFVTIAPILSFQYFSYMRLYENLRQNMTDISIANNQNVQYNLSFTLDAYEDILYQVYTDDEVIRLAKEIDAGNSQALGKNQLRRILQGLVYAKDGIESIMVVTAGGNAVYYDKLTASSFTSSWLGKEELTIETIMETGAKENTTELLASRFAYTVGSERNYLFHMAHRLIDYKAVNLEVGTAVVSVNENILKEICGGRNQSSASATFNFIIDAEGRIVTYPLQDKVGILVEADAESAFRLRLSADGLWKDDMELFFSEPVNGWRLVSAIDFSPFKAQARKRLIGDVSIGLMVMILSVLIIIIVTSRLYRTLDKVVAAMRRTQSGDLSAKVDEQMVFTKEMTVIASTYNLMMENLRNLLDEVRVETGNRKNAEIKALEAQINPHFLYNVLDGINWMAADNGQYEISKMVSSLARILRYSISNSNAIIPLGIELEWLRQYVDLQSMRFRESFELTVEVDESLKEFQTRKLILQPFVENAIVHGFKNGGVGKKQLKVIIKKDDGVRIQIIDNGKGIAAEKLQEILNAVNHADDHIGIPNAIGRIRMYYGDDAEFRIDSEPGIGTEVSIRLRKEL